jgi:hypothetical protein
MVWIIPLAPAKMNCGLSARVFEDGVRLTGQTDFSVDSGLADKIAGSQRLFQTLVATCPQALANLQKQLAADLSSPLTSRPPPP